MSFRRREKKHSQKGRLIIFFVIIGALIASCFLSYRYYYEYYLPNKAYENALDLKKRGDYLIAITTFSEVEEWKDSYGMITECYIGLFKEAMNSGELQKALGLREIIIERDSENDEELLKNIYAFAVETLQTADYEVSLNLLSGVLKGYMDSDYVFNKHYFDAGIVEFENDNYIVAYDIFCLVDFKVIPEAEEKSSLCKKILYNALIDEFDSINRIDGTLKMEVILPDGFYEPMLDGYEETEKYRLYAGLVGAWLAKNREKNIETIYELNDFLDVKEKGFAFQRLFNRRYINDYGTYFTIDSSGEAKTNIPHYHLPGYYGLYCKVENGVYYIGSDEVKWTKQFIFRFDDNDKKLFVYSYAAGREYALSLDESPMYS